MQHKQLPHFCGNSYQNFEMVCHYIRIENPWYCSYSSSSSSTAYSTVRSILPPRSRIRAGTILIDERLCDPSKLGRLRFTCAHELAHWVLHKKLYSGTGDVAAYNGNVSSDESHGIIERQADTLASALLMPLPQIKKCFYRLRIGRTDEQLIAEMANIFEVSKQAMQIRLKSRNLI